MDYSHLEARFKDSLYWRPKNNIKKFLLGIGGGIILLVLGTFIFKNSIFLSLNPDITSQAYGKVEENSENLSKGKENYLTNLSQDKIKRINIILIGIPGKPWPAPYLTDSIQIISINPDSQKILVIAIPRDLWVKVPGSEYETRINSLYSLENNSSLLLKKVKEITGIPAPYYIILDLTTLEKLVNILGGIDINVKESIYDPLFPSVSRGYETFSISAGYQHLDGKTAVKYIRSRHQKRGDFGRIERQQQVIEALRKKITKLNILEDFSKIAALFKEFRGKTNLTFKELKTFIVLTRKFSKKEINYFVIDAGRPNSLLSYKNTILGGKTASVLWPKRGKFNYAEIKEKITNLIKD